MSIRKMSVSGTFYPDDEKEIGIEMSIRKMSVSGILIKVLIYKKNKYKSTCYNLSSCRIHL